MPDLGFSRDPAPVDAFKPHPVENILPRRQAVEQKLRGEIAVRQRIRQGRAQDGLEIHIGRAFNLHPGGPIGTRPYHRRVGGDIARLNPARKLWPVCGAAEIGFCESPEPGERCGRGRADEKLASGEAALRGYRSRHLARSPSNRDGGCLLNLTPGLRFYDKAMTPAKWRHHARACPGHPRLDTRARKARMARTSPAMTEYQRCQAQMPPDLHGHVWIRVSRACASSGLPRRFASFARAGTRGRSAFAALTLGAR